nr:hypothetical protein TetV2_00418 [Oceanusvirus sp.]
MPSFIIPSLSTDIYHDGEEVTPGDTVVPLLAVVDGNNKMTFVRGTALTISDVLPPEVSGFSVAQDGSGYTFSPSAGTVTDRTREAVDVYHVVAAAGEGELTAAELLDLVRAPANAGGFGSDTVNPNTPGAEVALTGLSLGTSKVYDGGSFREIAEGDVVRNYLLAVNPDSNTDNSGDLAASAALEASEVADRTPPSVGALAFGAVSATSAQVTGLTNVTDGGSGLASVTIHYNDADTLTGASTASVPVSGGAVVSDAFAVSGLDDGTKYWFWVSAEDVAGNTVAAADNALGSVTTPDVTDPVMSGFDVEQGSGTENYSFAVSVGTVSDNVDGDIQLYLVMSESAGLDDAAIASLAGIDGANLQSSAKNDAFAYSGSPAAASLAGAVSTDQYHDGSVFATISEAAPALHQLHAYLLAVDAAGNASSLINSGGAKTVEDRTPPAFSGTLTASSEGSDSVTVSGLDGWSDGGGLASVTAYCGETPPDSDSAADVATWAALGTTASASAASPGDATATVTGLTANTEYHVRATATDAAGNASGAAATASTVTTDTGIMALGVGGSYGNTNSASATTFDGTGVPTQVSEAIDGTPDGRAVVIYPESGSFPANPAVLVIALPSSAVVDQYRIWPRPFPSSGNDDSPKTFELQGSTDGVAYVTVDSRTSGPVGYSGAATLDDNRASVHAVQTPDSYQFYRLSVTSTIAQRSQSTFLEIELRYSTPKLLLKLDFYDVDTVGNVWRDSSGNDNHASFPTGVYDDLTGTFEFTDISTAGHFATLTSPIYATRYTVFCLCKLTSAGYISQDNDITEYKRLIGPIAQYRNHGVISNPATFPGFFGGGTSARSDWFNAFHVIAISYDGETTAVRVYDDGVFYSQFTRNFRINSAQTMFGSDARENTSSYVDRFGSVRSLRIFNYVLSDAEIASISGSMLYPLTKQLADSITPSVFWDPSQYDPATDSVSLNGGNDRFVSPQVATTDFAFNGATYVWKFRTTRLDGQFSGHETSGM